ncbi:succinate CoA transferase [uncultured Duncaniella sp.]|mgnify:CR=1 FL=1|uniref:succinate CoA transferase n=1 Tax=uncultured Duncaniella sp. TaxID=2768039 RepID=UPI0026E9F6A9|nr:succinate CoA transferase [uncultured Duncaniella sp.]
MRFPILTPQEAAELFHDGDNVGLSGFTAPGAPKVIPGAIAEKAEKLHAEGKPFKINIFSGASTSDKCDGMLARANAIGKRTPYQNLPDLRKRINSHDTHYFDQHLSELAQQFRYGFYGDLDIAIIEVSEIHDDGTCVVGMGVGNVPTYAKFAKKIVLELNEKLHHALYGLHDIYMPKDPPYRSEIPVFHANDRIGEPVLRIDPEKIVGVVMSDSYDGVKAFTTPDETTNKIGANVCDFLIGEMRRGGIPSTFLPIQSGVGNVANAVLYGLADAQEIPPFAMYTEVIQDAVIDLMKKGRCKFGSTSSLTVSNEVEADVIDNIDFFKEKVVIRPVEISNNPEVIRRLGVIAMNTALEADIFGNINSTHVTGTRMMNGIGGSGDFARNAYISIFSCPSITKEGKISNIVPMVSHLDHSEHSVDILVTDQGIADLRGKDPIQRAEEIIKNCAHPMYKDLLTDYLRLGGNNGQTPHTLKAALSFHTEFLESGDMRNVDYSKY